MDNPLEKLAQLYRSGMNALQIATQVGLSSTHTKRLLKRIVVLRTRREWADFRNQQKDLQHPIICEDLSYVYGVYRGDGCITGTRILLQVTNKSFAHSFADALVRLGYGTGHVGYVPQHHPRQEMFIVKVTARGLIQWIENEASFAVVDKYPAAFLKGFFESEGHLALLTRRTSTSRQRYAVQMANTERELIDWCEEILIREGFTPRRLRTHTPAGRPYYRISLFKQAEMLRFFSWVHPVFKTPHGNPQGSPQNGIRVSGNLQRLEVDEPCE